MFVFVEDCEGINGVCVDGIGGRDGSTNNF